MGSSIQVGGLVEGLELTEGHQPDIAMLRLLLACLLFASLLYNVQGDRKTESSDNNKLLVDNNQSEQSINSRMAREAAKDPQKIKVRKALRRNKLKSKSKTSKNTKAKGKKKCKRQTKQEKDKEKD